MYSKFGKKITGEDFDIRIKDSDFIRIGEYVNSKTPTLFKCKKCGKEVSKPPKAFNSLKCNCEKHKDSYINSINNKSIELLEPYINVRTKVNHKCLKCGNIFKSSPKIVKNSLIGCPSCSGKLFSIDKYKSLLPKDIILISDEYLGSNKILKHKCLRCNYIWETKPNYIIHLKTGCPRCLLSKGEREIYRILDEYDIKYIHQYKININNINYKFDFHLEDTDIFIEYDGIQHFQPIDFFGGVEQYKKVLINDEIKNKWIIDNNKKLLRISYLENINDKLDIFIKNNIIMNEKRILNFKSFNEGKKNKFPNIKKMDIDGFIVYLGKDAKSNDHLTFNIADDDDIWMHTKGVPGSHVVIVVREKLPTPELIKAVALIAKQNSKASATEKATVVYCKRKFVKKEPGLNDGQVKVDYKNSHDVVI